MSSTDAVSSSCCGHKKINDDPVAQSPDQTSSQNESLHSCCGPSPKTKVETHEGEESSCCHPKQSIDWMLWSSLIICALGYGLYALNIDFGVSQVETLTHSVFELLNTMWFSLLIAFVFVGVLAQIPQTIVLRILGKGDSTSGLVRATLAGVLMDLCSHGILMVGMKLYQKGASLGQTMAFLVASPWNSFSLTLILIALIGWQWTLAFILLSMVLAVTTGWVFERLVAAGKLPSNPASSSTELEEHSQKPLGTLVKESWSGITWNKELLKRIFDESVSGSRIVLRWLLFGVVLASLIRAFVDPDVFQQWLGPSVLGLAVTLVAATIIEVCSEGSAPIAADIMNRTSAPGNGFAFLMAGVATDYTEVMVIKDTMKSWKIALFLPLITLPQVVVVALILNNLGT